MPSLILLQDGGKPFALGRQDVLIGRLPECEIQLDSTMVSRRHARIFQEDSHFLLEDLGSGNGTFLNGQRLSEPAVLHDGDRVKIGPILLRFVNEQAPKSAPASGQAFQLDIASGEHDQPLIMQEMEPSETFNLLQGRPEAKLKGVITITQRLAGATDVAKVLPTVLETLFDIFPAADRGVILIRMSETGKLTPAAQRQRQHSDESVRLSRTVLNKVIKQRSSILSADAASDDQFRMSESVSSLSIRSMMAVPLIGLNNEVIGIIHLDTQSPFTRFTHEDLELLLAVAWQAALFYDNLRLMTSYAEKVKQDSEMEIARSVQRALLPTAFPKIAGYQFFATYESAQAVGGDYYDAFQLPDGRVCVAFGDVAGKGVPGALIMSRLASCVRTIVRFAEDIQTAFTAINEHMCSSMVEGRFVTFILAYIDPVDHELELANAGHASPAIRHSNGIVEDLDEDAIGIPVGVVDSYPYDVVRRRLLPGDTVVITTDGVDEAMNPTGDLYTRERSLKFVAKGPTDVEDLTEALLADVRSHAAGRPQNDDITIMTFGRVTGTPAV